MEAACFGPDGKPCDGAAGFSRAEVEYDAGGKIAGRRFYKAVPGGEPRLWRETDAKGRLVAEAIFGKDGKPALAPAGFHLARKRYDAAGHLVEMPFFGLGGEPVVNKEKRGREAPASSPSPASLLLCGLCDLCGESLVFSLRSLR
ncbi:MAG: hypothetical protein K2W96_16350 [Gemmataceae bacterium]|nr:hypothetical protein [Gemmataceae bacterium]